jgi:hypothetical protein
VIGLDNSRTFPAFRPLGDMGGDASHERRFRLQKKSVLSCSLLCDELIDKGRAALRPELHESCRDRGLVEPRLSCGVEDTQLGPTTPGQDQDPANLDLGSARPTFT